MILVWTMCGGCFPNAWDGDWFLKQDPDAVDFDGDCDDGDVDYYGLATGIFTLFHTAADEVVLIDAESTLIGTTTGKAIILSREFGSDDGNVDDYTSVTLSASRSGGSMTGIVVTDHSTEGAIDYDCETVAPFTAAKIISHEDRYDEM